MGQETSKEKETCEEFAKKCEEKWGKKVEKSCKDNHKCRCHHHGEWGGFYFLSFIGAAFYFCQNTPTFWLWLVGIFKALFWPAFLIYKVFTMIHL